MHILHLALFVLDSSAGKCPASPLISSQEMFLHLAGNFCLVWNAIYNIYLYCLKIPKAKAFFKSRLSCAEIEVDHTISSLKHMQEVLYLT
jgi:hypothetical protein